MERISVFIDGANFYHGVKAINKKYSDFYFDFPRYIRKITGSSKLVDIYYFNAPLKQQKNQIPYMKQQLLLDRLRKAGFKVILCKRKRHIDKEGNEVHKIKEDDIRLALQVLSDAHSKKYDVALLFSGDGDFTPLPEFIKPFGKKMNICCFKDSGSGSLLRSCDFRCNFIDKKILNKYFNRDAYNHWIVIEHSMKQEAEKKDSEEAKEN